VILGLSLIICAASLNYFTAKLLVLASNKADKPKYYDLASGYGSAMTFFVKLIFFLNNWGIVVGYTKLVNIQVSNSMKSLFPNILPEYMQNENNPFWAIVINLLFIFPLSLQRNLSSLRYVCLIGFFFVMYVVFVIAVETFNAEICDYRTNFGLL